jgi:hypothetical protein
VLNDDMCPRCGWWIRFCKCEDNSIPHINTESWIEGWYEHIDTKPIYIRDKHQLIRECESRGLLARAFMKPKSRGKGFEHERS